MAEADPRGAARAARRVHRAARRAPAHLHRDGAAGPGGRQRRRRTEHGRAAQAGGRPALAALDQVARPPLRGDRDERHGHGSTVATRRCSSSPGRSSGTSPARRRRRPRRADPRPRSHGPLRVAIAGRVKAGKSTLLNALVGERLAPTDAGECTRLVSLVPSGATATTCRARLRAASTETLAFDRRDGALDVRLGGAGRGRRRPPRGPVADLGARAT